MTDVVVEAVGLRKQFGARDAVADVSFAVPGGSVFGLVGRNGAGKTTTIRLLLGLLRHDAGRSSIFGEDSLALSLSLDINRTLAPGGTETIALVVKFHDALTGIDFSALPTDDGALQLETGNSQMAAFRDKLTQGFTIDNSISAN